MYSVYYNETDDKWNVKDNVTGECYPMVNKVIADEMCVLLNHYDNRLHNTLDELYWKDRKFESLGYSLTELDTEMLS